MKKKIDVIAIVLYLALSMVVLTSGLYLCDALPRGLTASIDSFFKTDDLPVNNGVIIPPGGVTESIKSDTSFIPSDMSGVWFDLGNELADPETASASSLFAEINSYFDYFGNFRSNTVFITPDIFGKYSSVADSNGNSVDLLRETVGQAVMRSYYTVLVVNDSMLFNSSGVFDTQFVSYYLNNYTFDAVCISSEYLHANGRYNEAAAFFGDYIKREHPKKLLGIDIFPVSGGEYCSEDCKNSSCRTFFWGSFSGYSLFYPDLCYAGIFQGKRIKSSNQYFKDHAGNIAACRRPSGSRNASGIWGKSICPAAK